MMQAGGESAPSGFREQMAWQLRAARVLTDLLEHGAREELPVLEWTISAALPILPGGWMLRHGPSALIA